MQKYVRINKSTRKTPGMVLSSAEHLSNDLPSICDLTHPKSSLTGFRSGGYGGYIIWPRTPSLTAWKCSQKQKNIYRRRMVQTIDLHYTHIQTNCIQTYIGFSKIVGLKQYVQLSTVWIFVLPLINKLNENIICSALNIFLTLVYIAWYWWNCNRYITSPLFNIKYIVLQSSYFYSIKLENHFTYVAKHVWTAVGLKSRKPQGGHQPNLYCTYTARTLIPILCSPILIHPWCFSWKEVFRAAQNAFILLCIQMHSNLPFAIFEQALYWWWLDLVAASYLRDALHTYFIYLGALKPSQLQLNHPP